MAYGWISIHRKIQQSDIWLDKEPFDKRSAWIDLIMMANHEDKQILFNGKFIEVKRGEKITSLKQLSDRWRWSTGKVKRFLNLLESGSMIELKTKRRYTSYKVVNYNVYQNEDIDKRNENETKTKRKRNEDETKTETNNNINNELIMNNNTTGVVPPPEEMDLDNPKLADLIKLYQDCGFGLITPYSANMLRDYMNEYSYEWVKEAIEISEQNGVRTLAYIRGVLNKKKAGTNKPKNNYGKKQTYYRPKQGGEISEESRNLNNKIISNFMEKTKKEEVNTNAIAMQRMQEEFKKMRENNEKI
ncbi:MAG: DNA replication protein DnaD [Finegoldia magna]|uniref:DNA replication protein DnaD n=1 Tax=Finegoldia magna TaxID=1260 RepID=UPI00290C7CB2|nr:DNA replication protein DnaD [Finegoldia magna]MDU5527280.1 DNA replication protein DnaD [Finegoldia magna]